jgi:hypothetical protein
MEFSLIKPAGEPTALRPSPITVGLYQPPAEIDVTPLRT